MARQTKEKKAAEKAKRAAHKAECETVQAKGVCPDCGRALKFNNSLAGTNWFQCVGYGAEGFRTGEKCDFQMLWARD